MPQIDQSRRYDSVPQTLRDIPRWLLWRMVIKNGKKTKVPMQPNGVWGASPTNSAHYLTFDSAIAALNAGGSRDLLPFDGIGFVFNGDGITGIDLDHHFIDGKLSEIAKDILGQAPGYVEISPSGDGLHIITRTNYTANPNRSKTHAGVEFYVDKRFFTFTGNEEYLYSTDIPSKPVDLDNILATYFGKAALDSANYQAPENVLELLKSRSMMPIEEIAELLNRCDPDWDRDRWLDVGMILHFEGDGDLSYLNLWDDWSSRATRTNDAGISCYAPGDCDRIWETFSLDRHKSGKATKAIGTLVKMAKAEVPKAILATKKVDLPEFLMPEDLLKCLGPVVWQVQDYKEANAFTMVWGEPGAGKTFAVLDWSLSIATGLPWHTKPVRQGAVLYVAGEGRNGLARRVNGWCENHEVTFNNTIPFLVTKGSRNISQMEFANEVINFVNKSGIHFDEVIIDTLNRNFDGNENDASDIGKAVRVVGHIMEELNCSVTLVHHAQKAGLTYRGSSALKGAIDAEYEVIRTTDGYKVVCHKMKDAPTPPPLEFIMEFEEGQDAPVITLKGIATPSKAGRPKGTGPWVQEVMKQLEDGPKTLAQLKNEITKTEYTGGGADKRKKSIGQAVDSLLQDGRIKDNLGTYTKVS